MTTRIYAVLGLIALSFPNLIFSQTTLSGRVTDALSNRPLAGATIKVEGSAMGSTTDANGVYTLRLRDGTYTINLSYVGYAPLQSVVVMVGQPLERNHQLTPLAFMSDEVVIAAVRSSRYAPVSEVTRIRKEVERVYTGQDGAFLLERLSPSIVAYSESGTNLSNYGSFRLRGMDQTRVNMTLNGVPLNDMIDQGVFFSNFSDFGNSIGSVQVQRGVGMSASGTASYAGSINFESLSLLDTVPSAEIQITAGSFNTRRFSAEVNTGRLENNSSFYARYSQIHSDGFRRNTGTDSRSFFFSGGLFHERHTFKFTGFAGLSANGLGYLPVAISDINMDPRTNYVSENDRDNFGQWMAQLQHIYGISRDWSLINTVYYSGAGGDFPFGFADEAGTFQQINYPLYNDHLGAMSTLSGSTLAERLQVQTGLHAYRFMRRNEEAVVPNFNQPYYNDASQKDEVAFFGRGTFTSGPWEWYAEAQVRTVQLDLTPDADFLGFEAHIPTRSWTFFNPRAGATYRLSRSTNAYASLGRSGREPTRFDILGATQINAFNLPVAADLSQVNPEYVNNLEAGFRHQKDGIQVQANVFYMQFENEIAPIGAFIDEGFVQIFKNQEASYRTGMELDYVWQLSKLWRLRGNATYMRAGISSYQPEGSDEVFRDVVPILSPEWNVQTSLEVDPHPRLSLALRSRYLSEAFMELSNDPNLIVPSSFVLDLHLRYRFYGEHELSIQFNNVLDNQYFTYGAPVLTSAGLEPGFFVQPPRHLFATLHLRF